MNEQILSTAIFDSLRTARPAVFWLPRGLALLAVAIAPLPLALDLKLGIAMASTGPILWPLSALLVVAAVLIARRNPDRALLRTVGWPLYFL